jgi:hypothetical protein
MSKRKQKVDSTAPPQPFLREFPNWSFEQVREVALMLYAENPFKRNSQSAYFHWNGLIEEAFDFLDKLHKFYKELAVERSGWDAENRRREKEAAEALKLPDPVSVEKAMRVITDQGTTKQAIQKFQKVVRYNCRDFIEPSEQSLSILRRRRSLSRYGLTFETLNRQLAAKRKTGVPRNLVLLLREMFKDSSKEILSEENRAKGKKRKPWPRKRIDNKLDETSAIRWRARSNEETTAQSPRARLW